jgi:hypothetical protein
MLDTDDERPTLPPPSCEYELSMQAVLCDRLEQRLHAERRKLRNLELAYGLASGVHTTGNEHDDPHRSLRRPV